MNASWHPPTDSGMSVRHIAARGLSFEVIEAGEGDHLALCLHGYPELAYSWRHQIPLLAEMGYRVWAPNQRGYGMTTRPEGVDFYRLEYMVCDAAALFEASGARTLTLIGHDWGGVVGWSFAIHRVRPLDRLVVMNAPHPRSFSRAMRYWPQQRRSWYLAAYQAPELPERMLLRNEAAALRRLFLQQAGDPSTFPDAVVDVFAQAAMQPGAMTAMLNWYRAAPLNPRPRWLPYQATVEVPTLIIWGEEDRTLGLETLDGTEEFVPDLTVRRLPGIGHWVQQEAPDAVNEALRSWLPGGR
ncbi:alpha/beta hydrolase [uncultured Sphingomonas sp.]|uniref:alpha/beta fold hydrolase n=1 Tax=uncultured Sphingomonas sp. TaxID=158754 RepID=UPI0030F94ECE